MIPLKVATAICPRPNPATPPNPEANAPSPERALLCVRCNSRLEARDFGLGCRRCGASFAKTRHGLISLRSDAVHVGRDERTPLRPADEAYVGDRSPIASPTLCVKELDTDGAPGLLVSMLRGDAVAVDYGAGWGQRTRLMAEFCAHVYSLDPSEDRLEYSAATCERGNVTHVLADCGMNLPFAPGSIDLIVLDGALERIAEAAHPDSDPREVHIEFLRNIKRILKPNGQIYLAVANRFGVPAWLGEPDGATGLRFVSLLPRGLANLWSRRVRGRDYRAHTYSNQGYRDLLRDAGFDQARMFYPWTSHRDVRTIDTLRSLEGSTDRPGRRELKGRLFRSVRRWIEYRRREMEASRTFAPSFLITAHADGADSRDFSLLASTLAANDEAVEDVRDIVVDSGAWIVRTDGWRYRIGFTGGAKTRLVEETAAVEHVVEQYPELGRFTIESFADVVDGALIHVDLRTNPTRLAEWNVIPFVWDFLDRAGETGRGGRLPIEMLRSRLLPLLDNDPARLADLERLLQRIGERAWKLGAVHGDLRSDRIGRLQDGTLVIDRWERFQARGPLFLDPLHLCVTESLAGIDDDDDQLSLIGDLIRGRRPFAAGCATIAVDATRFTALERAVYLLYAAAGIIPPSAAGSTAPIRPEQLLALALDFVAGLLPETERTAVTA